MLASVSNANICQLNTQNSKILAETFISTRIHNLKYYNTLTKINNKFNMYSLLQSGQDLFFTIKSILICEIKQESRCMTMTQKKSAKTLNQYVTYNGDSIY